MRFDDDLIDRSADTLANIPPAATPRRRPPARSTPEVHRYRAVWISDFHLGTRGCRAERLLDFLTRVHCDTLYLVGDVIDAWALKKAWYWPASHTDVIRAILDLHRERGTRVVYVPGNHEYYESAFDKVDRLMADGAAESGNVTLLNGDVAVFEDARGQRVRVIGTTWWTDYCLYGENRMDEAMEACSRVMVDHRLIATAGDDGQHRMFTPADALARHQAATAWLAQTLAQPFDGKTGRVCRTSKMQWSGFARLQTLAMMKQCTSTMTTFARLSTAYRQQRVRVLVSTVWRCCLPTAQPLKTLFCSRT